MTDEAECDRDKALFTVATVSFGLCLVGFLTVGAFLISQTGKLSSASPVITGVVLMTWHLCIGVRQLIREAAETSPTPSNRADRSSLDEENTIG
jgi:hypothetical protein